MFSADLSWTEPNVEKVGERRERKARERSSTAGSIKTTSSSRSSISADRELWWTSGLKRAKGLQSSVLRPSSNRSTNSQRHPQYAQKNLHLELPQGLKDPTLQPSWTYATTLSPTLPSGAPFDLPVHEVPELEGDSSSRRTTSTSTDTRFSREQIIGACGEDPHLIAVAEECHWEMQTPPRTDTSHGKSSGKRSFTTPASIQYGKAGSPATEHDDVHSIPSPSERSWHKRYSPIPTVRDIELTTNRQPCPTMIDGTLSAEALKLHGATGDTTAAQDVTVTARQDSRSCPPLSQWQSLSPRGIPKGVQLAPKPAAGEVAVAHSSTMELTRFQRFIRRMESAGPRVVLDRLKEEWQAGEEMDEEVSSKEENLVRQYLTLAQLALEKQLWLLTGFQMQHPRVVPKPMCATGRILELYGNLCKSMPCHLSHHVVLRLTFHQPKCFRCPRCIHTKRFIFLQTRRNDRSPCLLMCRISRPGTAAPSLYRIPRTTFPISELLRCRRWCPHPSCLRCFANATNCSPAVASSRSESWMPDHCARQLVRSCECGSTIGSRQIWKRRFAVPSRACWFPAG